MKRSLGGVALGWLAGFLAASAWSAGHAHDPGMAGAFLVCGAIGLAILAVLLFYAGLRDRLGGDVEEAHVASIDADATPAPTGATSGPPAVAPAAHASTAATAARIAELEERLAREQRELAAALEALEEVDRMSPAPTAAPEEEADVDTSAEPALRAEVVDTVVALVNADSQRRDDIAREIAQLLQDAS